MRESLEGRVEIAMSEDTVIEQALPASPPSPRQVLLGWFIVFQLAFLIVSNLVGFLQWAGPELTGEPKNMANRLVPRFADQHGHWWEWCSKAEGATRAWMQLSGQDQSWSLFSPGAGKASGFPVIALVWENPPTTGPSIPGSKLEFDARNGFNLVTPWQPPPANVVWVDSDNAPADVNTYIKSGHARVRVYEGQLWINALPYDQDTRSDAEARMTRRMRQLMTDSHDLVLRYLQWRLKSWQAKNPDEPPPTQVILFERLYRIHGPDEPHGWDGPMLLPQARWLPQMRPADGEYAIQPFDYSELRFKPMTR